MSVKKDLSELFGETFNRWTIIEEGDLIRKKRRTFRCRCECGVVRDVLTSNVINGKSKSCGCLRNDRNREERFSAGHKKNNFKKTVCTTPW